MFVSDVFSATENGLIGCGHSVSGYSATEFIYSGKLPLSGRANKIPDGASYSTRGTVSFALYEYYLPGYRLAV